MSHGARGHRLEARRCGLRAGNRGLWVKVKYLHREEFVVVGWTDPEGSRPFLGALQLAYSDPDGRVVYAGRAGTGEFRRGCSRKLRRSQVPRGSALLREGSGYD